MTKKEQLVKKCIELGLSTKGTIADLESRIGDTNLTGASWGLRKVHELGGPMLCKALKSDDELDKYFDDPDWAVQRKINGCRMLVTYDGERFEFFSRRRDQDTCLPFDYTAQFAARSNPQGFPRVIFDCELTANDWGRAGDAYTSENDASTALLSALPDAAHARQARCAATLHVFDILYLQDRWLLNEPLRIRAELARKTVDESVELLAWPTNVQYVDFVTENKCEFTQEIIQSGGEGVVFKRLSRPYAPNARFWAKFKRDVCSTIGDTVDGWITGFISAAPGTQHEELLAGFNISFMVDGQIREVATISNLPLDIRRDMSKNPGSFIGKVVEFSALSTTARLRFRHAVFVCFREDKSPDECREWAREELESLVM